MKSYDVHHSIGEEVYFFREKSILKSIIDKIKIYEERPYTLMNSEENETLNAKQGISIQYLLCISSEEYQTNYDWVEQRDVSASRDELIAKIK
jgi:hypothetical protein